MDAWQRETHRNTATLISLAGATYAVPIVRADAAARCTAMPASTTTRCRWPSA
jgi:hypothetical protein